MVPTDLPKLDVTFPKRIIAFIIATKIQTTQGWIAYPSIVRYTNVNRRPSHLHLEFGDN